MCSESLGAATHSDELRGQLGKLKREVGAVGELKGHAGKRGIGWGGILTRGS